jgi:hypothetical protein
VASPDPLSLTPSNSLAVKTHNQQFPSPSASLVKCEETQENIDGDPDAPEPHLEEITKWNIPLISCAGNIHD